ncbi:uncharacterized protein EDB91DRAFT_1346107 [Suillus paluster]|uniref:uncharacterized protein n=1 Tax=Suillus paluster TaxID=48578 RepID=UPI001B87A456|nr:uncharacterized protein EDB91DRAFT_1346107 [Suillus paluster]KAG1744115.1 hypothetical protein EDB91DRAFT_1346107 [Suillus paluster]
MMQPEHLAWMVNPSSLDEEEKILAVLKILRGLCMTVMDLMLHSISQRPSMATWREGFFRSKALVQFLNVLGTDERASEHLHVSLRPLAIAMVIDETSPPLLLSFNLDTLLTEPLQETTPLLRRILLSTMQTVRAAKENKHQSAETLCTVIKSQIANIHSQNNLAFQIIHGLCLFSGGSSCKTIDLLAHCGLSPAYDTLHNVHAIMADGQIKWAQLVACGPHMIGWDNIQVSTSIHVEQRPLAPPKVQSGTTAII